LYSCDAGFYGPLCNLHCGDKCNGVKGFDTCDHGGNCLFGCKPPYSGAKCQDQDCPFKNCKRCDVSSHGNTYCWQCDSGKLLQSLMLSHMRTNLHTKF
jgi:hypothetical protein